MLVKIIRNYLPSAMAWQVVFVLLPLILMGMDMVQDAHAQMVNGYDIIQRVNQLRTSNGMPPYRVDAALMAAAQSHSEYQASIGSITHTGAGGTSARDRAIAFGYGDGAAVFVSENIAGGNQVSMDFAMQLWQGDALHLKTMLSADYQDVGAGVAISGNAVYFTLDAGYVAGSTSPPPPGDTVSPAADPLIDPSPTQVIIVPVAAATSQPDGSIIHIVQQGQALWNIAAIYDIELSELLTLNGLSTSALIFPGDELLVKLAEPTATADASSLPTAAESGTDEESDKVIPTRTIRPTAKPASTQTKEKPSPEVSASAIAIFISPDNSSASELPGNLSEDKNTDPSLLLVVAVFVVVGTALLLASGFFRRQE